MYQTTKNDVKLKAVLHQPTYLPYSAFFHKLSMADIFVILDNSQYEKHFTNRNKIIAPTGWIWITVPINKNHKFLPNRLVEINNDMEWKMQHWKKIYHSYKNAPYFDLYGNFFKVLYEKEWNHLCDLNIEIIKQIIEWLDLKIEIVRESCLNIEGKSTERLINCCKVIHADTYISGIRGKDYIDEKLFHQNNIKLIYQNYKIKPYQQHLSKSFVSDLSVIDLLMNVGPNSLNHINS